MKKHILNLSFLVIILILSGCSTTQRTAGLPPLRTTETTPELITLKTEGSPGQSFSAVLMVDGTRREISGVTPAEFPLECIVLVVEMTKVDGDGNFNFMIERQNGRGRFYTPSAKNLRRFRYYSGSMGVVAQN